MEKQASAAAAASSAEEKKLAAEAELKRREEYLKEQRRRIKKEKAGASPAKEEPWKAPYLDKPDESAPAPAPPEDKYDMRRALAQRFKQDMLARQAAGAAPS